MPGCLHRAVALDIMVADGGRCEIHIPDNWLPVLEENTYWLFGPDPGYKSSIIDINKEVVAAPKKANALEQSELDSLLTLIEHKPGGS